MAFNVKKRGKLTYYYSGDQPVLSAMVTEEQPDGDLKIYLSGLTGGYSPVSRISPSWATVATCVPSTDQIWPKFSARAPAAAGLSVS